jgi:IclR family acetate operon transcriptional repressor
LLDSPALSAQNGVQEVTESTPAKDQAGVGVVTRAAAILRVLGETSTGMSLGQIAKQVGLARSTVQRVVADLEEEGLVMTGVGAGNITLGPEFMRLAKLARPLVVERIRPVMDDLSHLLEETVDFSSIQRNKIVFLDQVIGSQRLLAVSHVGDSFPLHCSSVGKAYLATLTPEEVKRLIGTSYEALTPYTIRNLRPLLESLEATRLLGIGFDEEEHTEGICAVGIAFEGSPGAWYGLSVPMPLGRFRAKKTKVVTFLKKIRKQIEAVVAGTAEPENLRAVK